MKTKSTSMKKLLLIVFILIAPFTKAQIVCDSAMLLTQSSTCNYYQQWVPAGNTEYWYKFIADSSDVNVSTIQYGVPASQAFIELYSYSGACDSLTQMGQHSQTLGITGLTFGATYYVRVYQYQMMNFGICLTKIIYAQHNNAIITNESCEAAGEGSIDLLVTNGTPPYTYLWSNGATTEDISGLTAGEYIVNVTDNMGAIVVDTFIINNPPPKPNDSPACSELFISEYVEGTTHNTAIEIYNPTDSIIILNRYFLRVFMNGAPTPLIQQLVGAIYPGGTFVIANPNADLSILAASDQTSNKINFNGDDPIQFVKVLNDININIDSLENLGQNPHIIFDTLKLDTIDQVGIPGVDPGNQGYSVGNGGGTTKNSTLRRNYGVSAGTSDWACGQKQWGVLGQDDVTGLGSHDNECKKNKVTVKFVTATSPDAIEGITHTITVKINVSSPVNGLTSVNVCIPNVSECIDPPDQANCGSDYTITGFGITNNCPSNCWEEPIPDGFSGDFYFYVNIIDDTYIENKEGICFKLQYSNISNFSIDENNYTHLIMIIDNDSPSGVQKINTDIIKIYPSIVSENLTIDVADISKDLIVTIYNVLGETVIGTQVFNGQKKININTASLSTGIYFIKALTGNSFFQKKFVKH